MKKVSYLANPLSFAGACFAAVAGIGFAVLMIRAGRPGSAVGFGTVGLLFTAVAMLNGAIVTVDERGVTRQILFLRPRFLGWGDVREIGVCGTKLFLKFKEDWVGTRYIYISPRALDEKSRFDMVLRWPPREQIYLTWTQGRLSAIQRRWSGKIEKYNAGDIRLEDQAKN